MYSYILGAVFFGTLHGVVALPQQQQSTSLFIPLFSAQPINAGIAGVDAGGSTTWILQPGTATNSEDEPQFTTEATLVEGSDGAYLTLVEAGYTIGYSCTFSSGKAVCSGSDGGTPITETTTISSFAVAFEGTVTGGAPASVTSSPISYSGSSSKASDSRSSSAVIPTSTAGTSGSSAKFSTSQSGSAAAASDAVASSNSSEKYTVFSSSLLVGLLGCILSLLL